MPAAEEQRSRGAEEHGGQGSRGAEEQRWRGAEKTGKQGNREIEMIRETNSVLGSQLNVDFRLLVMSQ